MKRLSGPADSRRTGAIVAVLAAVCFGILSLVAAPAEAGKETTGLFVDFTATRNQEEVPESLSTQQMCPTRSGRHTFEPGFRVENRDQLVISDTFIGFEFTMTVTRSGIQPTLEKTSRWRVTRRGLGRVAGPRRFKFVVEPGDCVNMIFAPGTEAFLLSGEVLTASLVLTRQPAPAPPGPPPTFEPLASCTIGFDGSCPDAGPQCGASFAGGNGCVTIGVGSCYSSGAFSYELDAGETVTIELNGDLVALDVFFAARGSGQGTMTFLDASGSQVGTPLLTNGDCTGNMPPSQRLSFATPVRAIRVTSTGNPSFIDDFVVNPQ